MSKIGADNQEAGPEAAAALETALELDKSSGAVRAMFSDIARTYDALNHGLSLDGEALQPARVEWANDDQLRFVLKEGKKRQIRRMCELVGLQVLGLKRVRIGSVMLGALPAGAWRYLRMDEGFL